MEDSKMYGIIEYKTKKGIKAILNNPNICIKESDKEIYISFIPYNREITIDYIKRWTKKLLLEIDNFILYAHGFAFDGLYETNSNLIRDGCMIQNIYTNEYRTFKGIKE